MHNETELQNLLEQIDELYDASAQLPTGNEHWAQRSRMQVEIIQLCRELADMHDDVPPPYWMQEDAEPDEDGNEEGEGEDGVVQKIDDVARAATLPMYAYQAPEAAADDQTLEAHVEIAPNADDFDGGADVLDLDMSLEDAADWYATTAVIAQSSGPAASYPFLDGPMLPQRGA